MTNAELLAKMKAEIERLYNGEVPKHDQQCNFDDGYFTGIDVIAQFIDTFESEKPVPADLEEAAEKHTYGGISDEMKSYVKPIGDEIIKNFIAGAKWQKEQIMSRAIEAVARPLDKEIWCDLDKFPELEDGDDIRIIIIKEN